MESHDADTAQHIASECPPHSCNGDLVVLDTAARNLVSAAKGYDCAFCDKRHQNWHTCSFMYIN